MYNLLIVHTKENLANNEVLQWQLPAQRMIILTSLVKNGLKKIDI